MANRMESTDEIKSAYEKFLQVRGELFEVKMVPMNEEEIQLVEKNARFNRQITAPLFMFVGILAIAGSIWALTTDSLVPGIGMLLCSIAFISFSLYYRSSYRDLMEQRKKEVISGVVTARKTYSERYGRSYKLTLSRKMEVFVDKNDYEKVKLGDIVQYETLSREHPIKNSVGLLGHINDFVNT